MSQLPQIIKDHWSAVNNGKLKKTPSGWLSGNAVCCQHNGTTPDRRQRGGVKNTENGGIVWHCFNCGFKASWVPGRNISPRLRSLLRWLNVPDDTITKLSLEILRENEGVQTNYKISSLPSFEESKLPKNSYPIDSYTEINCDLFDVIKYMKNRCLYLEDYEFYWSPDFNFRRRLIIPFRYQGKVVGYTARSIDPETKSKYISEQQPGYVFNIDNQYYSRKYVLVQEGPIDAIHSQGVALTSFELNEQKFNLINQLNKEVVLIPDRDHEGENLVEQAIDKEWSVAMPDWDKDVKDVSKAVSRYGRLYTIYTIFESVFTSPLKIRLQKKKWF